MNSNDDEAIMTEMATDDEMENTSMNDSSSPAKSFASNGSPEKTPAALLQEFCVRKGIKLEYYELQKEGADHEPTFKYLVTVGELMATGSGQSKKMAKRAAAKAMLDKLNAEQQQSPGK